MTYLGGKSQYTLLEIMTICLNVDAFFNKMTILSWISEE